MLAPGEYLTTQAPPEPPRGPTDQRREPAPVAEDDEPESRSFLLILLRALGAIHS
jgi:hypothetical protein